MSEVGVAGCSATHPGKTCEKESVSEKSEGGCGLLQFPMATILAGQYIPENGEFEKKTNSFFSIKDMHCQ